MLVDCVQGNYKVMCKLSLGELGQACTLQASMAARPRAITADVIGALGETPPDTSGSSVCRGYTHNTHSMRDTTVRDNIGHIYKSCRSMIHR